jgi:hypothetical protein
MRSTRQYSFNYSTSPLIALKLRCAYLPQMCIQLAATVALYFRLVRTDCDQHVLSLLPQVRDLSGYIAGFNSEGLCQVVSRKITKSG